MTAADDRDGVAPLLLVGDAESAEPEADGDQERGSG